MGQGVNWVGLIGELRIGQGVSSGSDFQPQPGQSGLAWLETGKILLTWVMVWLAFGPKIGRVIWGEKAFWGRNERLGSQKGPYNKGLLSGHLRFTANTFPFSIALVYKLLN
jgi:hypothetical protein